MIPSIPAPVLAGFLSGTYPIWKLEVWQVTRKIFSKWKILQKKIAIKSKLRSRVRSLKRRSSSVPINRTNTASTQSSGGHGDGPSLQHREQNPVNIIHLDSEISSSLEDIELMRDIERVFQSCGVRKCDKFDHAIPFCIFWQMIMNKLALEQRFQRHISVQNELQRKQKSSRKIAEGSYGEIYCFRHADGTNRVVKIVPLDGYHPLGRHRNIPFEMAVPDIVSSKRLGDLNEGSTFIAPNFPIIHSLYVIQFSLVIYCSLNFSSAVASVSYEAVFQICLEKLGGFTKGAQRDMKILQSIYHQVLRNAWLAVSILTQLVAALSVAEAAHNFEHRDLHLGNILIRTTNALSLKYTIANCHFSVCTVGYHVSIIDFGLSRIYSDNKIFSVALDEMTSPSVSREPADNFWLDHLNVYDLMRKFSNGNWASYKPITNLMWLRYVSENLLSNVERHNPQMAGALAPDLSDGPQMKALRMLRRWNCEILGYRSAHHLLRNLVAKNNPLVTMYCQ